MDSQDSQEEVRRVIPRSSAGKRILIVEDNDETASTLQIGLEDLGYVVELAHNGPVALQVAKRFQPDICLLDIMLPVMDGYELMKRMRESALQVLHYIALTGHTQQFDRQRSINAGCSEHLLKPVRVHELVRVIEALYQS
jgi:CheY-like chemotaxis protein